VRAVLFDKDCQHRGFREGGRTCQRIFKYHFASDSFHFSFIQIRTGHWTYFCFRIKYQITHFLNHCDVDNLSFLLLALSRT
jgi:hypothetical protein